MGKKICFVSNKHSPFDDRIYWKLALSCKKEQYEVQHICFDKEDNSFVSSEGIEITTISHKHIASIGFVRNIFKLLRFSFPYSFLQKSIQESKADLFIICDLDMNIVVPYIHRFLPNAKTIYDVHDPFYVNFIDYKSGNWIKNIFIKSYAFFMKSWELKMAKKHKHIFTTENNWKNHFIKNGIPEVSIIHNFPTWHPDKLSTKKTYDLIYTGSLTSFRGLYTMIELVNEIKLNHNPNISLLLLGTIYRKNEKQKALSLIKKYHLEENITLKNSIPHQEVKEFYAKSKIGLILFDNIPTHHIILPIKIFEYMTFGLPIIGSNFGHIQEIISKNNCGISIHPQDIKNLAKQTAMLISNGEQREIYSKNAILAIKNNYNWASEEKTLLTICAKTLNE